MMNLGVGLKWAAIVALVLVVGWTSWKTIQYIQQTERDKILLEIQKQTEDSKKDIRDAIKNAPPINGDASDSLQYLENR